MAGFILLNPSVADADADDPTVRRCISFARSWQFQGIVIANLFAFRSADPRKLKTCTDPVGPENNKVILRTVQRCATTVCAWGNHGDLFGRADEVLAMLSKWRLQHFGLTARGMPRHPLYLRQTSRRFVWNPDARRTS